MHRKNLFHGLKIKNVKGWYLPCWDNHFDFFMVPKKDQWTYQKPKRDFVLSFVNLWNYALDIGGRNTQQKKKIY